MKHILVILAIGLMIATAFSGCTGGDKGTGGTGGNDGTGGGTGGNQTDGNATGNQTGNQTAGYTNKITLYLTLKDGKQLLTTVAPSGSEYQTVSAPATTTPALSTYTGFDGLILPETAKIKKATVKYWYTADGASIVTEADSGIYVDGTRDDATKVAQERQDVIAAGQVVGPIEFSFSGGKYDKGSNIGIVVEAFATSGGGEDTPATLKFVFGSKDYPSSVTFEAGASIFPADFTV